MDSRIVILVPMLDQIPIRNAKEADSIQRKLAQIYEFHLLIESDSRLRIGKPY